jgi:allophanate hydrolase subunit 2
LQSAVARHRDCFSGPTKKQALFFASRPLRGSRDCAAVPSATCQPREGTPAAGSTAMTGAQFEIRIDGAPRTYRDRKDMAIESAEFLKARNPQSVVEVKDLQSGDVTAVALRPG